MTRCLLGRHPDLSSGRDTLVRVLEALGRQADAPEFEVVVVDDGSRDGTAAGPSRGSPRLIRSASSGRRTPARPPPRNRGVEEARGRYDPLPRRRHRARRRSSSPSTHGRTRSRARSRRPCSATPPGRATGSVSPFLHHISEYGLQFGYGADRGPRVGAVQLLLHVEHLAAAGLLLEAGLFDTTLPARRVGGHRDRLPDDADGDADRLPARGGRASSPRHHRSRPSGGGRRKPARRRRSSTRSTPSSATVPRRSAGDPVRGGRRPARARHPCRSGRRSARSGTVPGGRKAFDSRAGGRTTFVA